MKTETVFAAIITYNRKEQLKTCLEKVLSQSRRPDSIWVIDNASSDGTFDALRGLIEDGSIHYHNTGRNLGGSGGFCCAFRKFLESDCDCIWGMDDDAYPESDALEKLLDARGHGTREACWTCRVLDYTAPCEPACHGTNPMFIETDEFIFLGFLLDRGLVQKVGLPLSNLFIYYDDINYSERVRTAGYPIYTVWDAVIRHPTQLKPLQKVVLGKTFRIPRLSRWKWYYYMRNGFLIYPRGHVKRKNLLNWNLRKLVGVLLLEPGSFFTALHGLFDGLRGIDGKRKSILRR